MVQWLSRRSLAEIGCIVLGIACLVQTARIEGFGIWPLHIDGLKATLAATETALKNERDGRANDRLAYRKAQADSAAKNKVHVADVEAQQKRITDDVEARYRADLARLRAERVQPANGPSQRAANGAGSSTAGPASSGPHPEAVSLPSDELLRAQETELQLNALIDWVLGQSSIDPNKP
jgi:hypothetical protein